MKLSDRVEQLDGPCREVDAEIAVALGEYLADPIGRPGMFARKDRPNIWTGGVPAYTGSLDKAMTLVPEGWAVERAGWQSISEPYAHFDLWEYSCVDGRWSHSSDNKRAEGRGPTPALALCAAALRARGL